MNISRTVTVVVSYAELVAALKAAHSDSIHIQSLPANPLATTTIELAPGGKGVVVSYTASVDEPSAVAAKAPFKLLAGPPRS